MAAAPHVRTARLRGIGSEFESLRDYEQGDDIRRIDWKATAKHRRLITRNYEVEPFRNVLLMDQLIDSRIVPYSTKARQCCLSSASSPPTWLGSQKISRYRTGLWRTWPETSSAG